MTHLNLEPNCQGMNYYTMSKGLWNSYENNYHACSEISDNTAA